MQITEALKHNVNTWDTGFGATNCKQRFLFFLFSIYSELQTIRTTQWSGAHRAASMSIPVPTMPLKHRSSSGRASYSRCYFYARWQPQISAHPHAKLNKKHAVLTN